VLGRLRAVVKEDVRPGRGVEGPGEALQLQSRREHAASIDFHEGDKINERALKALVRAAVALNTAKTKR
jgi:hypothetical protein